MRSSRGLGVNSNFVVELYGLRDDLLLVQNRGLLLVQIELDSLSIYNNLKMTNPSYPTHVYSLIEYCKQLLTFLGSPPTKHIYKEANGVVD